MSDPDVLVEVREAFTAELAAGILAGDLHVAVCFEDGAAEPPAHHASSGAIAAASRWTRRGP